MSATFLKHFDSITDPRIERCKKHELIDIILVLYFPAQKDGRILKALDI